MTKFSRVIQVFEDANFTELSDVFLIPKRLLPSQKFQFFNYYAKSIINNGKEYYLRSSKLDFCITPYSQYKLKKGAYFSIGNGLIGDEEMEGDVLLAEKFSKSLQELLNTAKFLHGELIKINNYVFLSKIHEEFALKWLKISITKKF